MKFKNYPIKFQSRITTAAQVLLVTGVGIIFSVQLSPVLQFWVATLAIIGILEALFSKSKSWVWLSIIAYMGAVYYESSRSIFLLVIAESALFLKIFQYRSEDCERQGAVKTQSVALISTIGLLFLAAALPEQKEVALTCYLIAAFLRVVDWPLKSFNYENFSPQEKTISHSVWAIKTISLVLVMIKFMYTSSLNGAALLFLFGLMGMFASQKKGAYICFFLGAALYKPELSIILTPALIFAFGGVISNWMLYLMMLVLPALFGFAFSLETQLAVLALTGAFLGAMNSTAQLPDFKTKDIRDLVFVVFGFGVFLGILLLLEAGVFFQNMTYENLILLGAAVVAESLLRVFVKTKWQSRVSLKIYSQRVFEVLPAMRTQEYRPALETHSLIQEPFWASLGLRKNVIENYFIITGLAAGIMWLVVFWWYSNT